MANALLLQIRNIYKSYGDKKIFEDASVNINEKQKIGVIGRNGAGKSTLFKMIMGLEEIDKGEVQHLPDLRLGYIPQVDPFTQDETIIGFLTRYTKREDWECAKVAGQFQLKGEMLQRAIGDLSGGYQMRVKLTATLLFEPNLLLLDEPTNYLDLSTLILLENFLKTFRGGFLCITHDREFLKKTATSTMEVEHGTIVLHPEPLEEYLEFKEEQKALAESVNLNIERKQKQLQTFVDRFGAKASMAKSAQSKAKQIVKMDSKKIGINHALSTVRMTIPKVQDRTGNALKLENLNIGYTVTQDTKGNPVEPFDKIIAADINLEVDKTRKVAILGDNGQGKSTLLKTIAGKLKPLSGEFKWNENLRIAFYAQHVNLALDPNQTVEGYLKEAALNKTRDDVIYKMMGNFLFKGGDSKKTISVLSGGEKARLCLAGIFLGEFDVILLDEPTNHLDFETVEAMGAALGEFNGTVFVVSHDRTFVNLLADEIWEVGGGTVKRVLGTYEDYVWQKEQEAERQSNIDNSGGGTESGESNKPARTLDKQQRIRLFELNKELGKLDKKIANIKTKDQNDSKVKEELSAAESKWLEVTTEIEGLS
jgi:ATP-binding cassette, subfamily F, member 3